MRWTSSGSTSPERRIIRSIGSPTARFDRIVDVNEISATLTASAIGVSKLITRSRMGLPYLCSPICRYGVSGWHSMKLPLA